MSNKPHLEEIKNKKTQEAKELYKKLGINDYYSPALVNETNLPTTPEKLYWTTLSNSSKPCSIIS